MNNPYDPANKSVAEMGRDVMVERLSRELQDAQQQLEQEKARNRRWQKLFGDVEVEHLAVVEELRQQLHEATMTTNGLKAQLRNAERARDELAEQLEERVRRVVEETNEACEQDYERKLAMELKALRREHETQVAELRDLNHQACGELENLQQEVASANRRLVRLADAIDDSVVRTTVLDEYLPRTNTNDTMRVAVYEILTAYAERIGE